MTDENHPSPIDSNEMSYQEQESSPTHSDYNWPDGSLLSDNANQARSSKEVVNSTRSRFHENHETNGSIDVSDLFNDYVAPLTIDQTRNVNSHGKIMVQRNHILTNKDIMMNKRLIDQIME